MTRQITLNVNDSPVPADYFVQSFTEHTVRGAVMALEGTPKKLEDIEKLEVSLYNNMVSVKLNGSEVPVNTFVSKILRSTMTGLLSVLKGVKEVNTFKIYIER